MIRALIHRKRAPGLMLTPLLDMFTIILIFLIVSFSAEDYDFIMERDLNLPQSASRSQFKPSINLAVGERGVSVEGRSVVTFAEGKAPEGAFSAGELPELVEHLATYYDDLTKPLPEEAGGEPVPPREEFIITVQADRELDYRTLHLVLKSCAKAGFFKHRLAVLRR